MNNHMNKLIYISVFIVSLAIGFYFLNDTSGVQKQDGSTRSMKTTTMDSLPQTVDVGKVPLDTVLTQTVTLKNTGSYPLIIKNVSSECGCVSASFEKKPIPVDSTGLVTLTVKPQSHGYFFKKVQVFTNTPLSPGTFTVKGFVSIKRGRQQNV